MKNEIIDVGPIKKIYKKLAEQEQIIKNSDGYKKAQAEAKLKAMEKKYFPKKYMVWDSSKKGTYIKPKEKEE